MVLGKEYPIINKMILNFQFIKIRAIYKIANNICCVDCGTGSRLQTVHWGNYDDEIGCFIYDNDEWIV